MEQQQQRHVNEATEEFADALVQSQRAAAERGINVQEQNAQLPVLAAIARLQRIYSSSLKVY